jgi:hypothetical protein
MASVTIRADLTAFAKTMNQIERQEFRTIIRNALLDTGFQTQKELRTSTYGRAFNPRQKSFKNVITSLGTGRPATPKSGALLKSSVERSLEIVIFDRTSKEYMERHARGGIKTPTSGSNLTIPGRDSVEPKRTGRGIPKRLRASALLSTSRSFKTKINGQDVIARRVSKARYPIQVMHLLEPSAQIRKTFNFYEDSFSNFTSRFPVNFRSNFNQRMQRVLKTRY